MLFILVVLCLWPSLKYNRDYLNKYKKNKTNNLSSKSLGTMSLVIFHDFKGPNNTFKHRFSYDLEVKLLKYRLATMGDYLGIFSAISWDVRSAWIGKSESYNFSRVRTLHLHTNTIGKRMNPCRLLQAMFN